MAPHITLITGPELRHRYFVNQINREFPVGCVLVAVELPGVHFKKQKGPVGLGLVFSSDQGI